MKKNINKLMVLLVMLAMTSCSDFLKENLQGDYSTDTFYKTGDQAKLALTGVYSAISFTNSTNTLWVFGDVASDDAVKGGVVSDFAELGAIDDFGYSRVNVYLDNQWKSYYEAITRANYLLYYLPGITMDENLKNRYAAEAKFLRAFCYFNLVNIYGSVPLRLLPPLDQGSIYVAKSAVTAIYDQIETDLTEAAHALPPSYTGGDVGRATKGSGWGLLAKAHIYQAEWSDALVAIDSLDNSKVYSLVLYQNNFIDSTQNNEESVFEIQHLQAQTPSTSSYLNQFFNPLPLGGYGIDDPTQAFVDEFETNEGGDVDPRLDYTVGRVGHNWINGEPFSADWSPTGYLARKQTQPKREAPIIGSVSLNYVYLRYADILLFKAEALNELNQAAQALVPLNQVRDRARAAFPGPDPAPDDLLPEVVTTSTAALRDAIRHERRVELGFEFHRYFDLMRYGQDYANEALVGTGFSFAANRYFLIPQSELSTNPAVTE